MSKRGHGEGSIYQRESDGRWVAVLSLPNGKRRYLYGKTRREVARQLASAQRDLQDGLPAGDGRQTLATYLTGWLETIRPPELAESTWRRYDEHVRHHLIPGLGHIKLAQLTPQQIQQLYTDLQREKGLASTTVHHTHAVLHRALEVAMRYGLVARNVASLVKAPRMRESDIHPLNRDETRAYLAAARGHRSEALVTLAIATGMRQGELLALHWRDVDIEQPNAPGRLSVTANLYLRNKVALIKAPKTKGSRRSIAFAAPVTEALRAHRTRQKAERLAAGPAWQEHDLVFSTPLGLPFSPRTAYYHHEVFLAAAGLPRISFHDLRHTAATLLLLQGVNPKIVSEMLGHASVSITLDIYSHVLPDMQQDAAAAMAVALGW
jgi:integrase